MNLTISVDPEVLKRARIRALQENTSINVVLSRYLEAYAGSDQERRRAVNDLLRLSELCRAGRGDRSWSRKDLYDR